MAQFHVRVTKTYQGELRGKTKWRGRILVSPEEGAPGLSIECSIIDGQNGPFVAWPSRQLPDGTYFNMVQGSTRELNDVLAKHILELLDRGEVSGEFAEEVAVEFEPHI